MKIDLLHNKIIKDTVSEAFTSSFIDGLVPRLEAEYGAALVGVQMYEDYLSDGFSIDGEFYYPLTLVVSGEPKRKWIKWNISEKKRFEGGVPYSYLGTEPLQFDLVDSVPSELCDRLLGRGIYFEGDTAPLHIESVATDKTFLVGKYSQSFIDELDRQISREIERMFSVSGLPESGVELHLVFAPGTYMEHIVEGVTYRRLLITARGCSARDLWIKWSRNNGVAPLTVSDAVSGEEVTFEIAEDVPHKVREKEYRFLVPTSSVKYQEAMGRKHVTEWRDLIKRAIKRGELTKHAPPLQDPEKNSELAFKLQEVLTGYVDKPTPAPVSVQTAAEDKDAALAALLRSAIGAEEPVTEEIYTPEIPVAECESELTVAEATETREYEAEFATEAAEIPVTAEVLEEAVDEPAVIPEIENTEPAFAPVIDEDELRRRIEAEIREKLELEARMKLEAETVELRRAHEALVAENERLAEIARKAEADKLASEAERIAEAEKLRLELDARERAEAREKERIAEAARVALLEQQRAAEAAEEEARRREAEEERIRAERERAEEEARIAEERRREEERIRAEQRIADEERIRAEIVEKLEAEARAAAAARAEEEARLESLAREAKAAAEKAVQPNYTFVSKNARLLFRKPVDPNITKRIHEIILTTIKYFHKENVYIKIKATVPDATTVNLYFEKIPQEENELLVNIIRVLGKSELGIVKAFLE